MISKFLDKGSIELIGPYGFEVGLISLSKSLTVLSTGLVTTYALYILIGFIIFVIVNFSMLYGLQDDCSSLSILLLVCAFFILNEDKSNN